MPDAAVQYANTHRDSFLTELKEFLAIPSISALPDHQPDIQRTAQWLVDQFTAIGLRHAKINPTSGHPVVTADWLEAGPDKPTVLIYGHYDVQPVDPLDLWHSDPFKAEVRDNYFYGRGTSDDKGQMFIHAKVLGIVLEDQRQTARQCEIDSSRARKRSAVLASMFSSKSTGSSSKPMSP